MKKFLLLALFALSMSIYAQNDDDAVGTTPAAATDMKFGYVSYSALLESMPDYTDAMSRYTQLEEKYAAETRRVEDEFNAKYEAFLEGQRDFPPTILNKRQSELQELLEKNIAFKNESKRLLADAKVVFMKPLREKLANVLATIGQEMGLAFIINTDNDSCPFINPQKGVDVHDIATRMLNQL